MLNNLSNYTSNVHIVNVYQMKIVLEHNIITHKFLQENPFVQNNENTVTIKRNKVFFEGAPPVNG